MPRTPRSPEEVEAIKKNILENALHIITQHGYEGFTMRKLAKRLGMTATPIYSYYANKEEIYLKARASGFNLLYEQITEACAGHADPYEKLKVATSLLIHFATRYPFYYKIMLTHDVPMYAHFVGTPLQQVAAEVVQASTRLIHFNVNLMEELAEAYHQFPKEEARFHFILWLTGIHGIVSLYNNTILDFMHHDAIAIIKSLADHVLIFFKPPGMT